MPKLIEADCRRPNWAPGSEVVLSDGQVWHFPRPRLVYRMRLNAETRIPALTIDASAQSPTYGDMLDRLSTTTGDAEFLSILTAMALELLGQNYTIPDDAVPDLFVFDPGSQVSGARWNALSDAVKGVAVYPKA